MFEKYHKNPVIRYLKLINFLQINLILHVVNYTMKNYLKKEFPT